MKMMRKVVSVRWICSCADDNAYHATDNVAEVAAAAEEKDLYIHDYSREMLLIITLMLIYDLYV